MLEQFKPSIEKFQNGLSISISKPTEFILSSSKKHITCPLPPNYGPPGGGLLLTRNLGNIANKSFCDLGTGYYALNAIAANLLGTNMSIGIETQPDRSKWAQSIIQENNLQNVQIVESNTIPSQFKETKFDVIVGNLPMMPSSSPIESLEQIANVGGLTGWEIIEQYLKIIPDYISQNGYIRLLILDYLGVDKRTSPEIPCAFERLSQMGLTPTIITSRQQSFSNNHPFISQPDLMQYAQSIYPFFPFNQSIFSKVIVEGKRN